MHKIDEKLLKENIEFDYFRLKRMTIILVIVIMTLELSLVTYNLLLFQEFSFASLYWVCTGIPILMSTISKVWYVALVYNIKQKFSAINDHFENTRKFFDVTKKDIASKTLPKSPNVNGDDENDMPGYLHKEILWRPTKRIRKVHRIDEISISGKVENESHGEFCDKTTKRCFSNSVERFHKQFSSCFKLLNWMCVVVSLVRLWVKPTIHSRSIFWINDPQIPKNKILFHRKFVLQNRKSISHWRQNG